MTRVLLVAPIPALRLGLRALLLDSGVEIIGEADRLDSSEFLDVEADVIIYASASSSFPDLRLDGSSAALLLLADDPPAVQTLARARTAWGVLPLECSREELVVAIDALGEGLVVGAAQFFHPRTLSPDAGAPALSDREMEVLGLLAQGLANKQIGAALGITEHTVKFHVSSIYAKLNATNRAEAVRQGIRQGLIAI